MWKNIVCCVRIVQWLILAAKRLERYGKKMDCRRYKLIKHIEKVRNVKGCPVRILQYNIYFDKKKNTSVLEIRMKNVDEIKVKYIDLEIERMSQTYDKIGKVIEYTYKRVNAKPDSVFGEGILIDLESNAVKGVSIDILAVDLAGGELWENENHMAEEEPEDYEEEFEDGEDEDYEEEFEDEDYENESEDIRNYEEEFGDDWNITIEDLEDVEFEEKDISKESEEFENEFEYEDEEYDEYDEEFDEDEEEYEDDEDEDDSGNYLFIAIAAGLFLLIATGGIGGFFIMKNDWKAKSLKNNGNFQEMVELLPETVFMKKDSNLYKMAEQYLEEKDYEKALELYDMCDPEYKDAAEKMLETRYLMGCRYMEEGKFLNASNVFYYLEDYKDSSDKYIECKNMQ